MKCTHLPCKKTLDSQSSIKPASHVQCCMGHICCIVASHTGRILQLLPEYLL